jgi:hypothetical protein
MQVWDETNYYVNLPWHFSAEETHPATFVPIFNNHETFIFAANGRIYVTEW